MLYPVMPHAPSFLALDIGNSAVKGALFDGTCLRRAFRLALTRQDPQGTWEEALRSELGSVHLSGVGLASVVPEVTEIVRQFVIERFGIDALVVQAAMRLPFRVVYETPHTLGADRLAAAAAAWCAYGRPPEHPPHSVVALDAGTAVTFEVVDRMGVYWGGSIAPGPGLLERALHTGTAQLPPVPLVLPERPFGRSTTEAIQAGLLFGFIDSVRGMLDRLVEYLGEPPFVVATGGWAPFLQEHVAAIDRVDPYLVLRGIQTLAEMNRP